MDPKVARIAETQFGLVTLAQLRSTGLPDHTVYHRAKTGQLAHEAKGLYRLPGTPHSREGVLLAAQLGTSGVLSHRSAAYLWSINGVLPVRPELIVPLGTSTARPGVITYRRRLRKEDVTTKGPFRLTTPGRTLSDLASILREDALEVAVDDAVTRGITSLDVLRRRVEGRRQGVAGITLLRTIVFDRIENGTPASYLETTALRALRAAGLSRPVSQFEIFGADGAFVARPDLAYPDMQLAIELDGDAYHATKKQRSADRQRQNKLALARWNFLRFDDADVRTGVFVRTLCSYLQYL